MRTSLAFACLLAASLGASAQTAKETKTETTTTTTATAPATKDVAAAASGEEVGISRRDGFTFSDGAAYVTRNGIMEKLVKEVELPGGVKVAPDGNVTMADGQQFRLRADQIVTLAGVVQTVPAPVTTVAPVVVPVVPVVPVPAPATNPAPTRDTSQATITGKTPNTPERVGGGAAAK